MNQQDFAYAPSSTHRNSDGLRRRFELVAPNWNKRPDHMESRAAAYARINHRTEDAVPNWGVLA